MDDSPQAIPLSKSAEAWANPVLRHLFFEKIEAFTWARQRKETLASLAQVNWACFYEAVPLLYREVGGFRGWKVAEKDLREEEVEDHPSVESEVGDGSLWIRRSSSLLHFMGQARASQERMNLYTAKVKAVVLPGLIEDIAQVDLHQLRWIYPNLQKVEYTFTETETGFHAEVCLRRDPTSDDFSTVSLICQGASFVQHAVLAASTPYKWTKTTLNIVSLCLPSEQDSEDSMQGLVGMARHLEARNFSFVRLEELLIGGSRLSWADLISFLQGNGNVQMRSLDVSCKRRLDKATLDDIVRLCPNLEELHIRPTSADMCRASLAHMAESLSRLPRLRSVTLPFDLVPLRYKLHGTPNPFKVSSVPSGAFASFPELRSATLYLTGVQESIYTPVPPSISLASFLLDLFPVGCDIGVSALTTLWANPLPALQPGASAEERSLRAEKSKNRSRMAGAYEDDVIKTLRTLKEWSKDIEAEKEVQRVSRPGWTHVVEEGVKTEESA